MKIVNGIHQYRPGRGEYQTIILKKVGQKFYEIYKKGSKGSISSSIHEVGGDAEFMDG